jgi:xanthine dehydrogenase YagS FAD-binding subunit
MQPFTFIRAHSRQTAIEAMGAHSTTTGSSRPAKFIGGGTNLVDLMKFGIEKPATLIDINKLPLDNIDPLPSGGIRIGALVRNSDLAWHSAIRQRYPVLSQALLSGASPQLRNMATTGGNLLQRTRCPYFYDPAVIACNKRLPGSGCAAIEGYNRSHAILGTSDACIATHPSDMCVALAALDATIHVQGPNGLRTIPFASFHLLPGQTPEKETSLEPGELITAVDLPDLPYAHRSFYLKVRDRASYEFALTSAAVILDLEGGPGSTIRNAHIALGGIATKPWRSAEAEKVLIGAPAGEKAYRQAADAAVKNARPFSHNAFKIELARRTLISALTTTGGIA